LDTNLNVAAGVAGHVNIDAAAVARPPAVAREPM